MARINARAKGAGGEREFCDWLHTTFKLEVKPQRNLEQVRSGGVDIICPPFAFEIKRVEIPAHRKWWLQVTEGVRQVNGPAFGLEPIVAFRQNSKDWEFLISAKFMGIGHSFIHIDQYVFKSFVENYLAQIKENNNDIPMLSQSGHFNLSKIL